MAYESAGVVERAAWSGTRRLRPRRVKLRDLVRLVGLFILAQAASAEALESQFCSTLEVTAGSNFNFSSENCSVIEGSLTIRDAHIGADSYLAQLLRNVVEITDYLVLYNVSGVASLDSLLPQLSVVRGRRLFASRYAISIIDTQLVDLGLANLALVQRGAVTIYRNVYLCLHTIDWRLLFDKAEVKVTDEANRAVEVDVYLHNNAARKLCISRSDCPLGCPSQWDWKKNTDRTYYFRDSPRRLDGERTACWNALLCQKECPKECAFACSTYELDAARRTSAANVSCCHTECLAGCSSDRPDSCIACRNAWHAGQCVSQCPAGWLRYLHRCITPQECSAIKDADSGASYVVFEQQCVPRCSEEMHAEGQLCQPCHAASNSSTNVPDADGKGDADADADIDASQCPRTCSGGVISSLVQAQALTDCNVVDSSLTIRIGYDSLSIMNPDAFSVQRELKACFRRLRVIKGRLRIIRSNILTSLDFLSNLRVIEGSTVATDGNVDTATGTDYAMMVIDNENLENVWTASNETRTLLISGGLVLFQMNTNLCPDKIVAFQKAANLSHIVAIDTNGLGRTCRAEHAEDGLSLEVQTVRPTVITLSWRRTLPPDVIRSEKTENHRFIGYIVYYKQYAFRNLTEADYAHTSQSSLVLGSNVKAWTSLSTGVNTVLRVTGLMPYTQYAFYVLRLASSREWTRVSDFVYERTKSARPSRPRILNDPEQLVNEASDAIAVKFRWLEPAQPNGIVQFYLIHVEKHEMQIDPDIIPRQCARRATETSVDVVNRSVETVIQHDALNNLALQCDHYEDKHCSVNRKVATEMYSDADTLPLSPIKTVVEQAGNFEAQQVSALYDEFDDLLSADMLDLHLAIDKERPRGDAFDDVVHGNRSSLAIAGLIQFLESEAARVNNTTVADEDTILDGSALDKDKDVANEAFLDRLDNVDEFRRLVKERVLYVHNNPKELFTTLRDLDIYTTYTIRVFACQNYSKLASVLSTLSNASSQQTTTASQPTSFESSTAKIDSRNQSLALLLDISKTDSTTLSDVCSKPATLADDFTTKGITERDSIEKKSITVSAIDSPLNVRLNWRSPVRPNGLVLFYEIEITCSQKATPQLLCHPAEAPTSAGAKVEQFDIRLSQCGDYKIRIRAVSLWGPGYWTELEGYNVTCSQSTFSPELTYTLSVVLPVVGVLLTVILVSHKICKEHKRKRAAVTTVNPDYVESFYIPDEWEVPRERVTTVRKLGAGTFGEVYEGVLHSNGRDREGVKVAIKTMRNASLRDSSAFLDEASIMKEFTDCFHIVKLMGIVSEGQPLVLMELMSNGDLKTFLRRHRPDADDPIGRPPPPFAYLFQAAAQIADGMAYLSEKKFVHRDLAARNCLVSEDFVVKIGDFGLARDIYESDYYRKEQKGPLPIRWMAPESLTDGLFDSRTDVWAYGVVLWEMGTLGEQPYQGLSNENVLRHVRDGNTLVQPDGCDDEFYDIMRRCWARRPSDRPTFLAILQLLQPHFEYSFTTVSWYHKCLTDQSAPGSNNHTAAQIVVHS